MNALHVRGRAPRLMVTGIVLALVAGCAKQEAAAPTAAVPAPTAIALPGGLVPVASILDLMLDPIDSSADFLWESVATVSTTTGTEDKQPRTDAEWKVVRQKAMLLMEAANLLAIEGRVVAHPGQQLEEPGGKGDYTPAEAQAEITKDHAAFVGFAKAFQLASGELLAAIDKRDVEAYLHAGGTLDEACEGCHTRFWYPNAPKPPGL
jgi:hypothetical protein